MEPDFLHTKLNMDQQSLPQEPADTERIAAATSTKSSSKALADNK
jgi:hypothetical protein